MNTEIIKELNEAFKDYLENGSYFDEDCILLAVPSISIQDSMHDKTKSFFKTCTIKVPYESKALLSILIETLVHRCNLGYSKIIISEYVIECDKKVFDRSKGIEGAISFLNRHGSAKDIGVEKNHRTAITFYLADEDGQLPYFYYNNKELDFEDLPYPSRKVNEMTVWF